MSKIVRQHQVKEGTVFTQWDDNTFTVHYESADKLESKPMVIGHIPYKKETDFEWYPEYSKFMEKIAENAWGYTYTQAQIKGLLPSTPPPVAKPKDYQNKRKGVFQIAESDE